MTKNDEQNPDPFPQEEEEEVLHGFIPPKERKKERKKERSVTRQSRNYVANGPQERKGAAGSTRGLSRTPTSKRLDRNERTRRHPRLGALYVVRAQHINM
jgi:hypothetical protein